MALSPQEELNARIKVQKELNEGLKGYLTIIKDIGEHEKNITALTESRDEAERSRIAAAAAGNVAEERRYRRLVNHLNTQITDLTTIRDILTQTTREANKGTLAFKAMGTAITAVGVSMAAGFGFLKVSGLFEMDKAIKQTALEMGMLGKQTDGFRKQITESALGVGRTKKSTVELGIGIEELAKMQASYSDEVGRTIVLGEEGNQAIAEMAKGTILGAEGAAKLSADMDNVGKSAAQTKDYIEQTMNDAHKMGLNASKVIKNIQSNIKLLNRYSFKGGIKGLASMAEKVTKMGVEMTLAASMADKLFDIEGAVEMSAQLQVLGGEWAKLADPFKLMYMARNDMEGLTTAIVNATKGAAQFNKESGEFDISALELHRLRKVAEQTGLDYEQLATAAKNAAKFTEIDSQIKMGIDPTTKDFIENTAVLNNKKEAVIQLNGVDRLVSSLTQSDVAQLKSQAEQRANLNKMAKNNQAFDDALKHTFTLMKTTLLPVVEGINEELLPRVRDFFADKDKFKTTIIDFGKKLSEFGKVAASIVGGIASFVTKYPVFSASLLVMFETAKWMANGVALGMGFNSIAGGAGGGIAQAAKGFGKIAAPMLAIGIGTSIGRFLGKGASKSAGYEDSSKGDIWSGLGGIGGGLGAAAILAALATGPVGWGALALTAGAGAIAGASAGKYFGDKSNATSAVHDGIFTAPIHDGFVPQNNGPDFSKGRAIINGGQITPIDNKDDLMAYKPKGVIDKSLNNKSDTMKIEFGEIKFKFDELKISAPGSPSVAINLVNDPAFIRNITRMIHTETSKAINGGKISPNPSKN